MCGIKFPIFPQSSTWKALRAFMYVSYISSLINTPTLLQSIALYRGNTLFAVIIKSIPEYIKLRFIPT